MSSGESLRGAGGGAASLLASRTQYLYDDFLVSSAATAAVAVAAVVISSISILFGFLLLFDRDRNAREKTAIKQRIANDQIRSSAGAAQNKSENRMGKCASLPQQTRHALASNVLGFQLYFVDRVCSHVFGLLR
jgi:hypothetical protein